MRYCKTFTGRVVVAPPDSMHNVDLILTLTAGLAFAVFLGFLALKVRLPPIVGYLVAGMLVGPNTPGFVANRAMAEQLAEVGVILLMFGVGLQFHLKHLLAVKRVAVTGALVQIATATGFGILAGRAFGWPWAAAAVFGVALSVASTVVLMRVLADHGDLQSQTGRIAVGWLVMEDIFTVFVLVLLPVIFAPTQRSSLPATFLLAGLKLAACAVLTLGAGGRFIPRLLSVAARTRSRELFTLTVLVIALGIAVGAAQLFGVSMALGAFLAGMVVGQSEFSHRAASEALPMRDAFAVLFFVSVGMLFDPYHLIHAPGQILATTAIVLLAKPLAAFMIVVVLGYGPRIAIRVAVALAQIGEFSFILATLGDQLRILPVGATAFLIAASILTIPLNPMLYRLTPALERALTSRARLRRLLRPRGVKAEQPESAAELEAQPLNAIIVGYGPVGQTVSRVLQERGISPTIIELNIETVRRLNSEGIRAVYGDAMQPDILREAGAASALGLIVSAPSPAESGELIRAARELNPKIRVLVRCAFLSQAMAMRWAGADEVFSGEAEVAMAMIEYILDDLGATPEQMDAERQRFRSALYAREPAK
ncbi:MAG: cation:proton antiporter [Bryobacteraceae bacterium]|nr:cation:proton antiporter [Bryobacteraceae bacterium]